MKKWTLKDHKIIITKKTLYYCASTTLPMNEEEKIVSKFTMHGKLRPNSGKEEAIVHDC